jgi:translation initiation factor 2B subunit (eIF-2B alpha/beta/delta family)
MLEAAARALVEAQPTMAPIFHLANRVLLRAAQSPGQAEEACNEFLKDLETSDPAAAKRASELVKDGGCVFTHSYSQTVLNAIVDAHKAGRRFRVISTESRPMREGVSLARAVGEAGIEVSVIVDAAIGRHISEANLAFVGADMISAQGLVNKIGTRLIALAAAAEKVPCYSVCSSLKLLGAGWRPPDEEGKPAHEITGDIPNGTALNYYYDVTPLDRLAGVITEQGTFTPGELVRTLAAFEVHPALR